MPPLPRCCPWWQISPTRLTPQVTKGQPSTGNHGSTLLTMFHKNTLIADLCSANSFSVSFCYGFVIKQLDNEQFWQCFTRTAGPKRWQRRRKLLYSLSVPLCYGLRDPVDWRWLGVLSRLPSATVLSELCFKARHVKESWEKCTDENGFGKITGSKN